ncbi:MAG: toxin-antitoxin system PIN domain toxin [Myxococcota bacterium]
MILVDANLLLYARLASYPEHQRARAWLDEKLNGREGVGLPWPSLLAFLRISTNPRIFPRPLPMDIAWRQVTDWLALPPVWTPAETPRHADTMHALVAGTGLTSRLVMHTHLAALAIDHGLILCSADRDFARFDGLRVDNPVA